MLPLIDFVVPLRYRAIAEVSGLLAGIEIMLPFRRHSAGRLLICEIVVM